MHAALICNGCISTMSFQIFGVNYLRKSMCDAGKFVLLDEGIILLKGIQLNCISWWIIEMYKKHVMRIIEKQTT